MVVSNVVRFTIALNECHNVVLSSSSGAVCFYFTLLKTEGFLYWMVAVQSITKMRGGKRATQWNMRIARELTTLNALRLITGCVTVLGPSSLEIGRLWHARTMEARAIGEVSLPLVTGEHVIHVNMVNMFGMKWWYEIVPRGYLYSSDYVFFVPWVLTPKGLEPSVDMKFCKDVL